MALQRGEADGLRSCTRHLCSGLGKFNVTPYVPTEERSNRRSAAADDRSHPQPSTTSGSSAAHQQRAVARRTSSRSTARCRRARRPTARVTLASRVGDHLACDDLRPHAAGIVYTTFHHPVSGANVVTTGGTTGPAARSKVTAVQVTPATRQDVGTRPPNIVSTLVRMANQIARQFTHEPTETAIAAMRHLDRFTGARMRADLARALDEALSRSTGVVQAVERLAVIV